ncbi:hypothetical protein LCGC14_1374540, partial [marine sediment metagenome]
AGGPELSGKGIIMNCPNCNGIGSLKGMGGYILILQCLDCGLTFSVIGSETRIAQLPAVTTVH